MKIVLRTFAVGAALALCMGTAVTPTFAGGRSACDVIAPTTCGNGAWSAIGFYSEEQCVASVEAECGTGKGGGNPIKFLPGPPSTCNYDPYSCDSNSGGGY